MLSRKSTSATRPPALLAGSPVRPWTDLAYRIEVLVKSALFGCKGCGQCLLGQTGLICPMTCPKGLRNGPCGGTKEGFCEVFPERRCVWLRIHERRAHWESVSKPLHAPVSKALFNTSSLLNSLAGRDKATRIPLPHLELPEHREPQTESRLEKALRAPGSVLTAEVRAPRTEKGMDPVRREISLLAPLVDGLNITSDHGGIKRLDGLRIAKEIRQQGGEAIVQVCGRDVDAQAFQQQLQRIHGAGMHNLLCLTGDWPSASQPAKVNAHPRDEFFPMDSAQMIYAARRLREGEPERGDKVASLCTPRLLIGAAINPNSRPRSAVTSRLEQKIQWGADFIQTQVICDADGFLGWLEEIAALPLHRVPILAGIPWVGSQGGLEALRSLPGVNLPDAIYFHLKNSPNISFAGCLFARRLADQLQASPLVSGLHFMNFGILPEQMAREIQRVRQRSPQATVSPTHANIAKEKTMAKTILRGTSTEISIQPSGHTVVIGERCNALGYKSVRKALEEERYDLIVQRAIDQEASGADVINVNMVGTEIPESEALPRAVELIGKAVSVPLSIDFNSFDALEAALEVAPGRPLINSVNGESDKIEQTLALAEKYGAALIAMPCDDKGIPDTAEGRLRVAMEIIDRASHFGISVDDLIFDAICLGVAMDQNAGRVTFETCRLLRSELGANIILGASNVSFGLPKRRTLDATYLAIAIANGMNVALTDVTLNALKWTLRSADCCLGQDAFATRYIQDFRAEQAGANP